MDNNVSEKKMPDIEMTGLRSDTDSSTTTLLDHMESDDRANTVDVEKDSATVSSAPPLAQTNRVTLIFWMVLNTVATVAIVFTNKAILNDSSFKQCQVAFAAFHFFCTTITLFILSRPFVGLFVPRSLGHRTMLPLAISMCLNIILMNISLAISTITFYQIARIMLTPVTALLNFLFYRKSLPRKAVISLIPMCLGVAVISYYEPKPPGSSKITSISFFAVVLAMVSVVVSAVYTIWVAAYQRKYEINGFQLLYNQAPLSAVILLYVIPWTDKFPVIVEAPTNKWVLILLSGFLASMINLSQFFIIIGAGPVSSTVIGHVKTCLIVALGWIVAGRGVTDRSLFGVILAIGSIFWYSAIMLKANNNNNKQALSVESETSSTYSSVTNTREIRSRLSMGLRALQPGELAHKVSSAVGGYIDFVRTTLSSSSSSSSATSRT